jgi:thiol-disulfide isomerase/thioredoxin
VSDESTQEEGRRGTAGPLRWVGIAVVLALAVGLVAALTGGEETCTERLPGVRPGVCLADPADRPDAPDTTMPVLGADEEVSLEAYAGDVVVLNFWASWCGPCRREQPELNDAASTLSEQGVSFLGVNVQDDSSANALSHEAEFDIPYPSIEDPAARYAAQFSGIGPRTLPSTVLVDRQGRVAVSLFGETTGDEVTTLARLLAEEPAA